MSIMIPMNSIPMLNSASLQGIVDTTLTGKLMGACSSMPSANSTNSGCVVLYTGTAGTYAKDHFYMSTGSEWSDLGTICGSVLTAKNVQVSWAADASVSGYSYKGTISLAGCTADHMPIVSFGHDAVLSGDYYPIAESAADKIYVWAKTNASVTVDVAAIL